MLAVIENEQAYPEGNKNRHTGAFATAVRTAMSISEFEETVNAMFIREKPVRGDNAYQLLFRCFLDDQLEQTGDDTFTGLDDPQLCLEKLGEILDDPDRWGFFYTGLLSRQVQSNIADRYKSIQLLSSLMTDRFESPPSYLDIGSSELHGPLKVVYGNDPTSACPPFGLTEILHKERVRTYRVDMVTSALANRAMYRQVEFGTVTGVDMTNIDDPRIQRWIEICSLKPYERAHHTNIDEFRLYNRLDPQHERVGFIRADFSSPQDFAQFKEKAPVEKYDIVSIKTVLHQLRKEERIHLKNHAMEVLSDKGVLVIQEFSRGDTAKKFNYLAEVIDMQAPDQDLQPIIRWEDGRCNRGLLEAGKIVLNGCLQTTENALRRYVY